MNNFNLEKWIKIGDQWSDIESSYRTVPYTIPVNRQEEKEKVIQAFNIKENYNPQFKYEILPSFPTKKIREFITILQPEESEIEKYYYTIAQNELTLIEGLQTRSSNIITSHSCLVYGIPNKQLVTAAQKIIQDSKTENNNEQVLSAQQFTLIIQDVLKKLEFHDWQVVLVSTGNAKISVNRLDKEIKIASLESFVVSDVNRLILHELGVHIFRYENGRQQPIKLFREGFPGYLSTEEGLAVFTEAKFNLLSNATLNKYCNRVIAAYLSLTHSFTEVLEIIAPNVGVDSAFDIVTRAKRGFEDTSEFGVNSKDICYLKGYLMLQNHLEKYPDDFDFLFFGKIGISNISLVKQLYKENILVYPKFLPSQLLPLLKNNSI